MAASGLYGGKLCALAVYRDELLQSHRINLSLLAQHRHLLGDVLQLTHVSRPLIPLQHLLRVIGQRDFRQMVFLGHLHGEESEQQHNVIATVAQRRNLYGNGVQTVVKVFAETSLTHGLAHIHVCGRHDAHIGLAYFLSSHTDILARFQHTQQAGLRGKRQFANLVKEYSAFVSSAEIALALAYGTRKRTFLVSEQLAVYRPFGNRTAVYGEVLLTLARRVVMNDTWNLLLSYTAFTDNQHAEVGRRDLQSHVERTVQAIAVAHDVIPLLDALYFRCVHLADKITNFISNNRYPSSE